VQPPIPAGAATTRLRIALIASVRHGIREPHAGGLERHTADLATSLRRHGHDVVVYASGESDPDLGVVPICPTDSRLDLSPAARADVSMLSERFMVEHHAYLGLMLQLADSGVDVVHDNSLHHLPVAMAGSIGAPVVKVLHTPPTPWIESALPYRHPSTVLVSVSQANAARWQVPIDHVIHNGVDLDRFPMGPGAPGRALWSGRIVPEKAPHEALEAAHLADADLDLAGPIADEAYWHRRVEPLLDDRRRWLGHLGRDALAREIGASAVTVVTPAWDEPYGLVVAESLACGTPVAGYVRGALPELLDGDVGVLVPPGDVPALAAAIRDAARLDRTTCRARAEATASLDVMTAAYLDVYTAAVAAVAPSGKAR
jgi:glycosyltransferase involved in cell wall biosynthesis